jgi:adenylate cyclase
MTYRRFIVVCRMGSLFSQCFSCRHFDDGVVHFIGPETLLHLLVGTYHRPVQERKVLLFLGINDSTELGETLGPFATRSFVRKFLSDVSQPITDFGGDIYLYKGDGLIAIWTWAAAITDSTVLTAVDAMFEGIARGHDA